MEAPPDGDRTVIIVGVTNASFTMPIKYARKCSGPSGGDALRVDRRMEGLWTPSYPHPVDRRDHARTGDLCPSGLKPLSAVIPLQVELQGPNSIGQVSHPHWLGQGVSPTPQFGTEKIAVPAMIARFQNREDTTHVLIRSACIPLPVQKSRHISMLRALPPVRSQAT
jgi:hypothetical protein